MSARRWVALVCGLVLACMMLGAASASELELIAPARASTTTVERCAEAQLSVAGASGSSTVTISGLPDACAALPLELWVHDSDRTYRGTPGSVAPDGTATVTVPDLQMSAEASALVTAGTWPLPTSTLLSRTPDLPFVSCRTPDDPSVGCAVAATGEWHWGWPETSDWVRDLSITTTSPTPVRWELVINLSHESLPLHPTRSLYDNQQGLVRVASSACEVEPRTVTVRGTTGWGDYHTVVAGVARQAQISGTSSTGSGGLLHCQ